MQVEINLLDKWLKRFCLPYVRIGIVDVIGEASSPGISNRLTPKPPSHPPFEIRAQAFWAKLIHRHSPTLPMVVCCFVPVLFTWRMQGA